MARTSQRFIPIVLVVVVAALVAARVASHFLKPKEPATSGVQWVSLPEATEQARSSGKLILFDFTAEWCRPCHQLDAEVFQNPALAAEINERFIPVRVTDRHQEEGRNTPEVMELQRRYVVRGFPTVVIADGDGSERARMEGFRSREDFERVLRGAR